MSDYRNLLRHSGNYLLATIATRALSFISIPVYTYLLTVEEYGVYNVFYSTAGIATIILTLNTEVAIGRYYYDAKGDDDFKRFVGTSVRLCFSVFCFLSFLLIIFCEPLSKFLGFEYLLTIAIIPVSLYHVLNSVFVQIYQPLLNSKKIAIVSSTQAYLAFALSVIAILLLKEKRYYGQVLGSIIAMFIIANYSLRQIKSYYHSCFEKKYLKYILSYSLPNLPYALSSIIVAQFGKLILGQQQGFESAGLYSFASNIAALMLIVIFVTHSAWNPFYFRYMNDKDYKSIDDDYNLIWRITLVCAIFLSFFGFEIGSILGRPEYVHQLYLIPILVVGYCFYQWSYVFMRNVGYEKKMIWNAVIVISSGVSNIVLNSVLLNIYGVLGIAISFSFSYMIMLILGWIVNRIILKTYTPSMKKFITPFCLCLLVLIYPTLYPTNEISFVNLGRKIIVSAVVTIVLMYRWHAKLLSLTSKIFKK